MDGLTLMIEILYSMYNDVGILFDATNPCETDLKYF